MAMQLFGVSAQTQSMGVVWVTLLQSVPAGMFCMCKGILVEFGPQIGVVKCACQMLEL